MTNKSYESFKEFWDNQAPGSDNGPNNDDDTANQLKADLSPQLDNSVFWVCFKKKDGSRRSMRCTLDPSYLPQASSDGSIRAPSSNEFLQTVFDLEINEYRSFRYDDLITYEKEA